MVAAAVPVASPPLNCPRCDSPNTKFCYYNNYSLAQPRHFCKSCKRYWTRGGTLRNVPIGGASRKNKRNKKPHRSPARSLPRPPPPPPDPSFLYSFPPIINPSSTLFLPNSNQEINNNNPIAPLDFLQDYSLFNIPPIYTSYHDDFNIRIENNNFDAQSSYLNWNQG